MCNCRQNNRVCDCNPSEENKYMENRERRTDVYQERERKVKAEQYKERDQRKNRKEKEIKDDWEREKIKESRREGKAEAMDIEEDSE